jgi:hypothetical protein
MCREDLAKRPIESDRALGRGYDLGFEKQGRGPKRLGNCSLLPVLHLRHAHCSVLYICVTALFQKIRVYREGHLQASKHYLNGCYSMVYYINITLKSPYT